MTAAPRAAVSLAARGIAAEWRADGGQVGALRIGGASVLWSAPWRSDIGVQSDRAIPAVDRHLGGTFACAPFGQDDVDGGPPHGEPAGGRWHVLRAAPGALRATCAMPRGRVTAIVAVRDDHPALYQTHVLDLLAPCTFAHHPIFSLAAGGRIAGPPPRAALTFAAEAPWFEQGARAGGWRIGARDLRRYPDAPCEDFATVVAAPGLGWTALERHGEGDTILLLRRAEQLPTTNLWFSNGARGGIWAGTRGLLGIEDAICAGAEGFAAALSGRARVAREGVPTALPPERHVIPHAIVRLPGRHRIREVRIEPGELRVESETGTRAVPFDGGHLR